MSLIFLLKLTGSQNCIILARLYCHLHEPFVKLLVMTAVIFTETLLLTLKLILYSYLYEVLEADFQK